jgi:hypothetical protein
MANPIRAARKEGRKMVKGVKQGIKAEKITKKFQAKADKIGMKARQAEKAKAPSESAAGTASSEPIKRMEPRKAPLLETKKAELAKGSPMKVAAAPAKKSSSAKSKYGPYKRGYKAKDTSDRTTGIPKIPGTPVTGTGKPFFKKDDSAYRKKETPHQRALAQINKNRKNKGLPPLDDVTAKAMGGTAKPSYKKGGYMMNTKKKKK